MAQPKPENDMNTNNYPLIQLLDLAADWGVKVQINKSQPLYRQRQAVIDAMREHGVRIENTVKERPWNF